MKTDNKVVSKNKVASKTDPMVAVGVRAEFYGDGLLQIKRFCIASLIVLAISLAVLVVAISRESKNVYFAVHPDGSVIRLVALNQPNQKDAAVSDWLSRALVDTFDFSYYNMKPHLTEATMKWFNDNGRQELLDGLEKTGNFEAVIKNKLIVGLTVDHTPLVAKKGVASFNNTFMWKLEVPATITYRTESNVFTNKVLFTVTVSRRSLLEDRNGLGIERIVMEITGKSK